MLYNIKEFHAEMFNMYNIFRASPDSRWQWPIAAVYYYPCSEYSVHFQSFMHFDKITHYVLICAISLIFPVHCTKNSLRLGKCLFNIQSIYSSLCINLFVSHMLK